MENKTRRMCFNLNGLLGGVIATLLLLSILAFLTIQAIAVQKANATNFYELEDDMKLAIQEMDERFMLENYELEEFYIKARRADIYDLEMAILWSS
jgi:hypothetical protein